MEKMLCRISDSAPYLPEDAPHSGDYAAEPEWREIPVTVAVLTQETDHEYIIDEFVTRVELEVPGVSVECVEPDYVVELRNKIQRQETEKGLLAARIAELEERLGERA